ncbi:LOW QUALITY PROTEIN: hypothetical protein KUTeg_023490 [Tegillarca granosa]|uniref:Uncharacterized protein n=1 Tax=Tegillarca granosa TaxID=220873 RepID=A0ABQ9E7D4_TEGGR|nr:LOW QUALITY PROTEIN: hypothetical protein KUTeg_023490 [Tegillarca granosa]
MKFTGRQFVVFSSLYLSYTLYVYVRRSFSFSIPDIANKEKLDKSQFGLITSSQSLAYTISKFVDFVSPRLLLAAGLISSGATAFVFTGFKSVTALSSIWFLNGLSQGPGWPASAVILKQWVAPEVFGTAWSILSTSMNVPWVHWLQRFIINQTGWQYCMQLAGSISITYGFISVILIKNKSKNSNQNSNSTKKEEENSSTKKEEKISRDTNDKDKEEKKKDEKKMSRMELLKIQGYVGICMSYLVTTLAQYCMLQWAQLYIVNERKQSFLLEVGNYMSWFCLKK